MNLPNKLTMVRIALVPLVVIVYLCIGDNFWVMDETSGLAFRDVLVFIIFATASITDMLDGMIARKYHLITSFGKFVDPIADKLLVNTVLIMLAYTHQANIIAVLLMIARDLFDMTEYFQIINTANDSYVEALRILNDPARYARILGQTQEKPDDTDS